MTVSRDLEPLLRGIDPVPDLGFRIVFGAAGLASGVVIRLWPHGPERVGRSWLRHGFVLPGLLVLTVQVLALLAAADDFFSPATVPLDAVRGVTPGTGLCSP